MGSQARRREISAKTVGEEVRDNVPHRVGSNFTDLIYNRRVEIRREQHDGDNTSSEPRLELPQPVIQEEASHDIERSNAAKEQIRQSAKTNADYYISRQVSDRENPKPWFKYPRVTHQYSEFVLITPEMARTCLEHLWNREEGNRRKKDSLVEAYKRDIENDRWIPTDESIGINMDFEVYNGQHRLWAIFESGKAMPMYVTFNVLTEAKFFVDSGAVRTVSERLKMVVNPTLGNRTAGFCKSIMRGTNPKVKFTAADIAEFAFKWQPLLDWISYNIPTGTAETQGAIGKAYIMYGPERLESFCKRLLDIQFQNEGDPAKALYLVLEKARRQRTPDREIYRKTLQAAEHAAFSRDMTKLHARAEDLFQWAPGWEAPANSWYARNQIMKQQQQTQEAR